MSITIAHPAPTQAQAQATSTATVTANSLPNGGSERDGDPLELSVVIPCLNEHETIGICVRKAVQTIAKHGIAGEVIVADNGSADGSQEIAIQEGARVVPVAKRGYGNALMGGIEAARGKFVIMGDADDSYDFQEIPKFLAKLREGFDLVQGCRLPWGGGTIKPGAMPPSHRWLGNPMFTMMSRVMFRAPIHDIYCGMRGFTKDLYKRLNLRCAGMEFATEMIIKASLFGEKIAETPTTLWPDGRKTRRPHLRTFRDGWRTLRFFLLFSPKWLFWYPGWLLMALGGAGCLTAALNPSALTIPALLGCCIILMLGLQAALFAVLATTVAVSDGLVPMSSRVRLFFQIFTLERGALMGLGGMLAGAGFVAGAWLNDSASHGLLGATGIVLGAQTLLSSLLCSMLGMQKR